MQHPLRIAALAAALMAAASASVLAQTTAPAPNSNADAAFVTVQPQGQWLASGLLGQVITNEAGEKIGAVNDVLFDKSGRIVNVVIGVGGFLGIGEKVVAVPFSSLSFTADPQGKRVVMAPLSKARLEAAPEFQQTEKSSYMRARDSAVETARELRDKAEKKLDEMRGEPKAK
jgi:hypothetical protein